MALAWERQCVLGGGRSYGELRYDDATFVIDAVRYQNLDPRRMFVRVTQYGTTEIFYVEIPPNTSETTQNIPRNRRPVYDELAFHCGYLDVA